MKAKSDMGPSPFVTKYNPKTKRHEFVQNGISDSFKMLGVVNKEKMRQKILKKEYTVSSFDVKLLERLIKILRAFEDKYENVDHEIFFPRGDKGGAFIIHPIFSDNYYLLAPRVMQQHELKEPKK